MNTVYQHYRKEVENQALRLDEYKDPTRQPEGVPAVFWLQSKLFGEKKLLVTARYDRQFAKIRLELDGLVLEGIDVLLFADNENGNVYRLPDSNLVSFHLREVIEVALQQYLDGIKDIAARIFGSPEAKSNTNDDSWGEDPGYPRADWQQAVSNGDTQLGYQEWVTHQVEAAGQDRCDCGRDNTHYPCKCGQAICQDCEQYHVCAG